MADGVKISSLPSATTPSDNDVIAGVQNGTTKKFSFSLIKSWLQSLFVPTSRKVNNKTLTADITLDASDVGAVDVDDVGVADGVASLDSNGKVPGTQLDLSNTQTKITASGILKGDGAGGISAATAGTDYQAPLTAGTDYATPTQLADKANQAQLAYVETGTTTSRAYSVGEYFCWNGLLYRAKTAISNGASFTPGTNCEQVTGGGLNEVKGIDISSYISVNLNRLNNVSIRAKYYPGSRKVELQASGSAASSLSAAQNTLFLVASPYSVGSAVQFIGSGLKNTSNIVPVYISTGSVNMQHGGLSAGDNVAISISWYV